MLDVSNIYEQSWKYAYRGIIPDTWLAGIPSGRWANGLKQPDRLSLVLFDDGKMCGTASYCHARMESMKDYGEIVSIYLLPEVMHMGYGYQLMKAVISELKNMGFKWTYVLVPLGVIALAGGGMGTALFLKRRAETSDGEDAEE